MGSASPQGSRRRWLAIGLLPVLTVAIAVLAAWLLPATHWRVQIVALAAMGKIPGLDTPSALRMVRPGSGYWVPELAETRNAYVSIANPFTTPADVGGGAGSFRSNCAACHGADAMGRELAPALVGRSLVHGNGDWAMYRTILKGLRGTSMPPHDWSDRRIWQTIAYIRSLGGEDLVTLAARPQATHSLDVDIPAKELAALRDPQKDWLTYSGSYFGTRHSQLTQIDTRNVAHLVPRWLFQLPEARDRLEATPIVRGGVMFVSSPAGVEAIDARTGSSLWKFERTPPADSLHCCGNVSRGVAALGDRLFYGTVDARLIAISARTGKRLWETSVVTDYREGYSITSAPIAFRDLVVTGVGGGDYPTRGCIVAFDAETGKERWRFWTVPGPGEPGHETWAGESWRVGGGTTWMTGSYDPELDLLYWGVGNPAPDFNARSRTGDNLYTNSVVALRGTTGRKVWHFQFTPGDDHDWDSAQVPVVVDRPGTNTPRQLLWANRNGFYYVLDRETGKFLSGTPFVHQTWAKSLDAAGRPIRMPGITPTSAGTFVYPSVAGATNWWSPSYDPDLDLMLVPALEQGSIYYSEDQAHARKGELYLSGATATAPDVPAFASLIAINATDGKIVWRYRRPVVSNDDLHMGGLVTTRTGLVFGSHNQTFYALDSRSGRLLWSFATGGRVGSAPISYEVAGEQYVLVASGATLIAFALPPGEPRRLAH